MRRSDLDELRETAMVSASTSRYQDDLLTEFDAPPTGLLIEQLAGKPLQPRPLIFNVPSGADRGAWLAEWEAAFEEPGTSALGTFATNPARVVAAPSRTMTEADEAAASTPVTQQAMVALYPSAEQARRLAMNGGEPPEKLHITLAYLGTRAWDEHTLLRLSNTVRAWAERLGRLGGVISGAGVFTEGPDPCTYLSVDMPALPGIRQELVRRLDNIDVPASRDHGFTPHMTLSYSAPPADWAPPRGEAIAFDHVSLAVGDRRWDFPLMAADVVEACRLIEAALLDHAQRELNRAGLMDDDSDYGGMLGKSVLKLVKAMEGEGHSGMSAQMAIDLFGRLARYEPLTPLTDDPGEWRDISDISFTKDQLAEGKRLHQSVRNPSAFSEDGGKTYHLLEDRTERFEEDGATWERGKPQHKWPPLRKSEPAAKAKVKEEAAVDAPARRSTSDIAAHATQHALTEGLADKVRGAARSIRNFGWNEEAHPRAPKGTSTGGEFVAKPGQRATAMGVPLPDKPGPMERELARRGTPMRLSGEPSAAALKAMPDDVLDEYLGTLDRKLGEGHSLSPRHQEELAVEVERRWPGLIDQIAGEPASRPRATTTHKTVLPPGGRPEPRSPGRSPKGNLRNFKGMSDEKLADISHELRGHKDTEAVTAVQNEIKRRLRARGKLPPEHQSGMGDRPQPPGAQHREIYKVERADRPGEYRTLTRAQFEKLKTSSLRFEGADGDEAENSVTYWHRRVDPNDPYDVDAGSPDPVDRIAGRTARAGGGGRGLRGFDADARAFPEPSGPFTPPSAKEWAAVERHYGLKSGTLTDDDAWAVGQLYDNVVRPSTGPFGAPASPGPARGAKYGLAGRSVAAQQAALTRAGQTDARSPANSSALQLAQDRLADRDKRLGPDRKLTTQDKIDALLVGGRAKTPKEARMMLVDMGEIREAELAEATTAQRPPKGARPEDDPAFNWRKHTGKRGVILRDGRKAVVNPEVYDRLRRQGAIDEKRTPRLRGDVDEPDLEFIDGSYDESSGKYEAPHVYSAGEKFPVGARVTGILGGQGGGRRVVGRLHVEHNGVITVAGRKVKRIAAAGEHLAADQPAAKDAAATAADGDDAPVSEAAWEEVKHPRDDRGRFRRVLAARAVLDRPRPDHLGEARDYSRALRSYLDELPDDESLDSWLGGDAAIDIVGGGDQLAAYVLDRVRDRRARALATAVQRRVDAIPTDQPPRGDALAGIATAVDKLAHYLEDFAEALVESGWRPPRPPRMEDHPDFNWRRDGNGKRGVVLRDGRKVVVNGPQFDHLASTGQIDARTPRLRGDKDTSAPPAGGAARPQQQSDGRVKAHMARSKSGRVHMVREFIRRGQSGRPVQAIQHRVGATPDGKFGPQTAAKVRAFQQAHGLKVDGIVGKQTASAMLGNKSASKVKTGAIKADQYARLTSRGPARARVTPGRAAGGVRL